MRGKRATERVGVRLATATLATCALAMTAVFGSTGAVAASGPPTASGSPTAKPTRAPTAKPAPVRKGAGGKVVYLTFDDGPHPVYTPQILWLLEKYDAKATFFMVGSAAKTNPKVAREVRRSPHSIGNHTYSHPWLTKVTSAEVRRQLRATDALLGQTRCMRPPGGFVNSTVRKAVAAEGKSLVMWNVDTRDWARPGAAAIARTAIDEAGPGRTILMHDGGGDRSQTVRALAQVLRTLRADGYRFETLPACRR